MLLSPFADMESRLCEVIEGERSKNNGNYRGKHETFRINCNTNEGADNFVEALTRTVVGRISP